MNGATTIKTHPWSSVEQIFHNGQPNQDYRKPSMNNYSTTSPYK